MTNTNNFRIPKFVYITIPEEIAATVFQVTKQQDHYDTKLKAVIDLFRNRLGYQFNDETAAYMAFAVSKASLYCERLRLEQRDSTPAKAAKLSREISNLFNLINVELKYTREHVRFYSHADHNSDSDRKRFEQFVELSRHCAEIARQCFGNVSKEYQTQLEKYNQIVADLHEYLNDQSSHIAKRADAVRTARQEREASS